jgi:hypothetical protein
LELKRINSVKKRRSSRGTTLWPLCPVKQHIVKSAFGSMIRCWFGGGPDAVLVRPVAVTYADVVVRGVAVTCGRWRRTRLRL